APAIAAPSGRKETNRMASRVFDCIVIGFWRRPADRRSRFLWIRRKKVQVVDRKARQGSRNPRNSTIAGFAVRFLQRSALENSLPENPDGAMPKTLARAVDDRRLHRCGSAHP